jgi:integrase
VDNLRRNGWTASSGISGQIAPEYAIHRLTYGLNPKIWLGVKWLATYISIRPGELVRIKEEHIDLERGYLFIPHPKEKRPKLVPLRREDVELIRALPRGLPHLPFFRHPSGLKGIKGGAPFGEKYLYKWWKRACENLGIEGVDLYGGTRHSSASALRKYRTPEEIKRATCVQQIKLSSGISRWRLTTCGRFMTIRASNRLALGWHPKIRPMRRVKY